VAVGRDMEGSVFPKGGQTVSIIQREKSELNESPQLENAEPVAVLKTESLAK